MLSKPIAPKKANFLAVLILVLMEYALEGGWKATLAKRLSVLILVLMEYALEGKGSQGESRGRDRVLILVLMEYALEVPRVGS